MIRLAQDKAGGGVQCQSSAIHKTIASAHSNGFHFAQRSRESATSSLQLFRRGFIETAAGSTSAFRALRR